jgi:hypothetical protein
LDSTSSPPPQSIILSTTTWLGGHSIFLGIAYLVTGGISLLFAIAYIMITVLFPREVGGRAGGRCAAA